VQAALTDMGSGCSSLRVPLHPPVDKIKLDKTFTTDIHPREANQALVRANEKPARTQMFMRFWKPDSHWSFISKTGAAKPPRFYCALGKRGQRGKSGNVPFRFGRALLYISWLWVQYI